MAAGEHAVVISWGFVTIPSKAFFDAFSVSSERVGLMSKSCDTIECQSSF